MKCMINILVTVSGLLLHTSVGCKLSRFSDFFWVNWHIEKQFVSNISSSSDCPWPRIMRLCFAKHTSALKFYKAALKCMALLLSNSKHSMTCITWLFLVCIWHKFHECFMRWILRYKKYVLHFVLLIQTSHFYNSSCLKLHHCYYY